MLAFHAPFNDIKKIGFDINKQRPYTEINPLTLFILCICASLSQYNFMYSNKTYKILIYNDYSTRTTTSIRLITVPAGASGTIAKTTSPASMSLSSLVFSKKK